MVKVFNSLNIQVSCLGNHDLDFGIAKMKDLVAKTAPCTWLMSNINVEDKPIGDLLTYTVKQVPLTNGDTIKTGFIGLAGNDWLDIMVPEVTEEL